MLTVWLRNQHLQVNQLFNRQKLYNRQKLVFEPSFSTLLGISKTECTGTSIMQVKNVGMNLIFNMIQFNSKMYF